MRPGYRLLDFPEYPDDGRSQTDNDTQEHERQSRDCEHVQHPKVMQTTYQQTKRGLGD